MNNIKSRMKSVTSTMQITKAMELVATSKLRRAKEKAESSRPFGETLRSAISELRTCLAGCESPWDKKAEGAKTLYIVIAGDRGLAGGYNSSIFKLAESLSEGKDAIFLPIGKKALEYFTHRKREIYSRDLEYAADVGIGAAFDAASSIAKSFAAGEFSEVILIYTEFASMISQIPRSQRLLPLDEAAADDKKSGSEPLIGGDAEEVLDRVIPYYIGGMLNTALCDSLASESGARRTAMNSANKNAEEMIEGLTLSFNRARQAQITQEITEIVSGAEAL